MRKEGWKRSKKRKKEKEKEKKAADSCHIWSRRQSEEIQRAKMTAPMAGEWAKTFLISHSTFAVAFDPKVHWHKCLHWSNIYTLHFKVGPKDSRNKEKEKEREVKFYAYKGKELDNHRRRLRRLRPRRLAFSLMLFVLFLFFLLCSFTALLLLLLLPVCALK